MAIAMLGWEGMGSWTRKQKWMRGEKAQRVRALRARAHHLLVGPAREANDAFEARRLVLQTPSQLRPSRNLISNSKSGSDFAITVVRFKRTQQRNVERESSSSAEQTTCPGGHAPESPNSVCVVG